MTLAHRFLDFAAQLRAFMAKAQLTPTGTEETEFNRLALLLFSLQFEANSPYRHLCEAKRVTPLEVTHWSQIPCVPTTAFKELELSCLPTSQRTAVFFSSGTTKHRPSRHFHSAESLALYEDSLLTWFDLKVLGHSTSSRQLIDLLVLTPEAPLAPHSSLVHMFHTVCSRFGTSASTFVGMLDSSGNWTIDFDKTIKALRELEQRERPVLVLGTAFSFVNLLDYVTVRGLRFDLPAGSRALETGGYKGRSRTLPKPELHRLIQERLGTDEVICEYGMSELSSQAYAITKPLELPDQTSFQFPPWARAQIISSETGRETTNAEPGLMRVFDLANVYSVLALQTEDLAIARSNGFDLLGRATVAEARGCSLMSI